MRVLEPGMHGWKCGRCDGRHCAGRKTKAWRLFPCNAEDGVAAESLRKAAFPLRLDYLDAYLLITNPAENVDAD